MTPKEKHRETNKLWYRRRAKDPAFLAKCAASARKRRKLLRAKTSATWVLEAMCRARRRAKAKGLAFAVSITDLAQPSICPVLHIPIVYYDPARRGRRSHNSPSLDRIIASGGYVVGNVRVISNRANELKSNATLQELRLVLQDLERHT